MRDEIQQESSVLSVFAAQAQIPADKTCSITSCISIINEPCQNLVPFSCRLICRRVTVIPLKKKKKIQKGASVCFELYLMAKIHV